MLFLALIACQEYTFNRGTDALPSSGVDPAPPREPEASVGDPPTRPAADGWELEPAFPVDVIFFGDTSTTMTEELETLGQEVTIFADRLDTITSDWQIITVTGPDGCSTSGILTPETQDFQAAFAAGITSTPADTTRDEWGLYNVAAAIAQSTPWGCNAGFLRPDSLLNIIFISDENDESAGWDEDPDYWRAYLDAILDAREDPGRVQLSAVAGPAPEGCDGADPGFGYAEAVDATGGAFLSICDAWYQELGLLAEFVVEHWVFPLEEEPLPESLEVRVNGALHDDWAWRAEDNAVVFLADPPLTWDSVTITYDVFVTPFSL